MSCSYFKSRDRLCNLFPLRKATESSPTSAVNVWFSHHTALPSELSSSRRLSHVSHVLAMEEPSASVLAPGQIVKAAVSSKQLQPASCKEQCCISDAALSLSSDEKKEGPKGFDGSELLIYPILISQG